MAEPGSGDGAKAVDATKVRLAAAQLELRRSESQQRLLRLARERRALEEVRAGLATEERALSDGVSRARAARAAGVEEAEALARRGRERAAQALELDEEVAAQERRLAEAGRREGELALAVDSAGDAVARLRREIAFARGELEAGREALVGLSRRLSQR